MPLFDALTLENLLDHRFSYLTSQGYHDITLLETSHDAISRDQVRRPPIEIDLVVTCRTSKNPGVTAYIMVATKTCRFAASYEFVIVVEGALPIVQNL